MRACRANDRAWRHARTGGRWSVVGLIAVCLLVPSAATAAPQQHVVLVGVTQYHYLAPQYSLNGPVNDVELMRDLLTTRFHIAPDRITVLDGWPRDEARRPTRANIAHAFRRLAEVAGPEDQVVIYLSGHGSQQPANDAPDNVEPDGLDELFLPADVRGWDPHAAHVQLIGSIENAIVDDEIRAWVMAIQAKGAFWACPRPPMGWWPPTRPRKTS